MLHCHYYTIPAACTKQRKKINKEIIHNIWWIYSTENGKTDRQNEFVLKKERLSTDLNTCRQCSQLNKWKVLFRWRLTHSDWLFIVKDAFFITNTCIDTALILVLCFVIIKSTRMRLTILGALYSSFVTWEGHVT